jgi:hypothetical protein
LVKDGQFLAVFNSTHRVLKAEELLKSNRIKMLLLPAPRAVQADCGLAIRFDQEQYDQIIHLLEKNDLLPAFLCQLHGGDYKIMEEFKL